MKLGDAIAQSYAEILAGCKCEDMVGHLPECPVADMWKDEYELQLPTAEMGATSQSAYDPFAAQEATPEELVEWFVKHGWLQSKQELVDKLLKTYKVVKR